MRIYTRGGDQGKTSLIGGSRRFKDDVRVNAYGSVDEAGAFVGLASAQLAIDSQDDMVEVLHEVSQVLWDVGADLAATSTEKYVYRTPIDAADHLEPLIDRYQAETEKLSKFVLRGGTLGASQLQVACTIVRRAERQVVQLMRVESIHPPTLKYLNRLSDLLFAMARAANGRHSAPEVTYRNSPDVFR